MRRHYGLFIKDRSPDYIAGHRHGVRASVAWLHRQAEEMNDPKAREILNTAAFQLGAEASHARQGCRCHYTSEIDPACPVHGDTIQQAG